MACSPARFLPLIEASRTKLSLEPRQRSIYPVDHYNSKISSLIAMGRKLKLYMESPAEIQARTSTYSSSQLVAGSRAIL